MMYTVRIFDKETAEREGLRPQEYEEHVEILVRIQSAIKIGGDGASRIQLDVPSTEIANVVRLVTAAGKTVKVTIEIEG